MSARLKLLARSNYKRTDIQLSLKTARLGFLKADKCPMLTSWIVGIDNYLSAQEEVFVGSLRPFPRLVCPFWQKASFALGLLKTAQ